MTSIGHCSRSTITLTRPLLLLSLIVFSTAWNLHDPPEFGTLHPSEVDALRKIGKELKKDWDFTQDPCSNKSTSWRSSMPKMPMYVNQVICGDCSLGVCHVVNISLKGQNLTGVLPPSLTKLPYLKVIDLVRNYINGSIPRQWASMKLEYVSVIINRLSGKIPKQLGDMSTLTYLNLESNQFSGEVPAELGKLVNLQSLRLKANNLTGQLPNSLAGLKNLTEFWIGSNNFSGKVPDFFTSWKKLQKLDIQGSGFMGPIPSSISNMTNLIELRISDLRGEGSEFPPFQNMTKLRYLVLRNCNISGFIPENIADNMPVLKTLDLSFNNLKGSVPIGLKNLMTLENMFLTSNLLNGAISDWIQSRSATFMDLSYNNFDESSVPSCYRDNLNLFRSSSRQLSKPLTVHTRNFPCSKVRYSLHINCGGKNTTIGSFKYEGDEEAGGSAKFVPTKAEWGFSSSGNFWSRELTDDYIARNDTVLDLKAKDVDSAQLYTEARKSAMSLTYYGRCLAKGKYNVTLHFAEITFIQSKTFYSLGRRIFDVYIQENLELQDFDIVKEANGTGKVIQKNFPHIEVTETGSIEIRLYYAAKGTTDVPTKGIYGPLISAISVVSEFDPPNRKKMISLAIGCAVSLMVLLFTGFGAIVWRRRQKEREARQEALRGFDLQIGLFTLDQIEAATNSFDAANLIGKGGFGFVYKGTLSDGTHIAVKKLSSRSSQGNKEFVTEIGMISGLHHPNLVRLYGCCIEGSQLFLVYEYMENNNLGRALFDRDNSLSGLNWHTRCRICIGIARGLIFLHEESSLKIVHRDIKPTNVLLDKHLNAKLSDFGLARLREEDDTHIDTRIAGTVGYMAPEYALWGYLTHKADVYSFGVVALEIVAGRSNMSFQRDEHYFCLVDQAFVLQKKGKLLEIIDPRLGSDYNKEEALRMVQVAILCTNASPTLRPMMSEVVRMLEGDLIVRESTFDPSSYEHWMTEASARQHDQMESELQNVSESRSLIHPSTKFWSDSTS